MIKLYYAAVKIAPHLRFFLLIAVLFLIVGIPGVTAKYIVDWGPDRADLPNGADFIAVSAGATHSLALKSDGSIVAWGIDENGQLNVPAGIGYKAIDADWGWSVALKSDGSIVAWGINDHNQLGVPSGTGYKAVAAGSHQGVAIKSDGSLAAWGESEMCSVPSGNNYIAVSSGDSLSIALKSDGTIVAWGWTGVENEVPSGNDFIRISAGAYHGLAIKSDKSVVAWGYNGYGQCNVPSGNNFVAISGGAYDSIALTSSGAIKAWGSGMSGTTNPVKGNCYSALSTSYYYNCALSSIPRPIAKFTIGTNPGKTGVPIVFKDKSSGSPFRWEWNFGDGSPLINDKNPDHTYQYPGTFTIQMRSKNEVGWSEWTTSTVDVKLFFSGYFWTVRNGGPNAPQGNYWNGGKENVFLDQDKRLHLKITQGIDGKYYCPEIESERNDFGYGKYLFYLDTKTTQLDMYAVLGLFVYDDHIQDGYIDVQNEEGEIDIEFGKYFNIWETPNSENCQYALQNTIMSESPKRRIVTNHRFKIAENSERKTSHYFIWNKNSVKFKSFEGHAEDIPNDSPYIINKGTLSAYYDLLTLQSYNCVPTPDEEQMIMNLWLTSENNNGVTNLPHGDGNLEVIVSKFKYIPA